MKQLMFSINVCLLAVVLAGCASGPDFKTYSSSVPAPKEGEGRVWFYRPSKAFGVAVQPEVKLNEQKVGKAQPGAFFFWGQFVLPRGRDDLQDHQA